MPRSWRKSAIADRHTALGSKLEDWNGMGTAWTYRSDMAKEYLAIRQAAGLMDVSGLKKLHIVGPHAAAIIDRATTRDVYKLYPGKSVYACMLNDQGHFIEDCIVYRISANSWMVVHGSGNGHEELTRAAQGRDAAILFDDDLHDLSLQGPLSVDFLAKHVAGIRSLNYFHHIQTTLFDRPVTISRTGYTGERGYEIFCKGEDAPIIWDTILSEGAAMGIVPCCFSSLDWLRVESYLVFYPYDHSEMYPYPNDPPGDSLWELGLDFTVSPGKTTFRGAEQHYRLKGKERIKLFGVAIDGDKVAEPADELFADGKRVGIITFGMYSPIARRSLAMARIDTPYARDGTALEVRGKNFNARAIARTLPFDDPKKTKRTAKG
jgi:glycine cleavage system T protein (aminomethyltransferase)